MSRHRLGCPCARCPDEPDEEMVRKACAPGGDAELREIEEYLYEYGLDVLVGWGCRNELREEAMKRKVKGAQRIPAKVALSESEASDLANETLLATLKDFATKRLPEWDPKRGASLKTFFITAALWKLPNAYEKWLRLHYAPKVVALSDQAIVDLVEGIPAKDVGPDDLVAIRDEVREQLPSDPVLRRIIGLRAFGKGTAADISAALRPIWPHMTEHEVRKCFRRIARDQRRRRR